MLFASLHGKFYHNIFAFQMCIRDRYGFFPSKVFCDINQVRATGIPKYLRNAPSILSLIHI